MSDDVLAWPLDNEQQAAVIAPEPAIAVLAGPGSGKTRTLSYRTRFLLESDDAARALLLTFTNKAAAEMKARALASGGLASSRIQASTFHAFGARMLRNHGALVGIDHDFDFLDDESQALLADELTKQEGVRNRLKRWSYKRLRREEPDPETAAFGEEYEKAKRKLEVVDFDDLVVYTSELLESNDDIAAVFGARYRHLLIDEFQDTNAAQFSIVQALAGGARTVSVFADDDQAIFRFAGAELENVSAFVRELEAKVYPLNRNYRCRSAIVDAANSLIACDADASGRQMISVADGGEVRLHVSGGPETEAAAIVSEIDALVKNGTDAGDIAILVRSGYRADDIVSALRAKGLPVSDWRGANYEPRQRKNLATCLSVVRGKLSDRQASRLSELLGVDSPAERESSAFLLAAGGPAAEHLNRAFEQAHAGASPSTIVGDVQLALAELDPRAAEEMDEIIAAVNDFRSHDPDFSLDDLMSELALGSGGRSPTSGGGVKVATLHKTKGLQWPVVYLVGLEEGHLPDYRKEDNPVREERRMCFVGICRAERELVLSRVRMIRGRFAKQPSRFIGEMGLG